MSDDNTPVPAASLLLVRDGDAGVEVLMVKRSEALRNFSGMWVFPGGRIDPADHQDAADMHEAAINAAIRETAEEAGLVIDSGDLVHLSRWTAPEDAPKRFDTWFFVGVIEDEQDVVVDGGEIHDHRWIAPADVLAEYEAGEYKMMPPTFVSLLALDGHADTASLRAAIEADKAFHFTPRVCAVGESLYFLYRGDAGFESLDAEAEGPRHRCVMEGDTLMDGKRLRYICEIDTHLPR